MYPRVESFFRFLVTHSMGALACFLSVFSLHTFTGFGRILPLAILSGGLLFAWQYRQNTGQTRDAIVTALCALIALITSYHLCLRWMEMNDITSLGWANFVYGALHVFAGVALVSAVRDNFWNAARFTLFLLVAVAPLSIMFLKSGAL